MSKECNPHFSVVVCAFNEQRIIESCLKALVDQSFSKNSYEVLVIDDESTDNTFDIVSGFINSRKSKLPYIRLVRIRHSGLSVARNTGTHLSKGEIVAFIDGDAVADKDWLSELAKAWDASSDADVIGGRIKILNAKNIAARFFDSLYYDPADRIGIIGANMSFRKRTLLHVGGFGDPFISRGDETFLLKKIGSDRKEVKWPEAIVYHERPISVKQWMKERGINGEMSRIIQRILNESKPVCVPYLVRRGLAVVLFAGVAAGLSLHLLWGVLILQLRPLLRGCKHQRYKNLRKNNSLFGAAIMALSWLLLDEVGMWLFIFGRWRGRNRQLTRNSALKGSFAEVCKTISTDVIA